MSHRKHSDAHRSEMAARRASRNAEGQRLIEAHRGGNAYLRTERPSAKWFYMGGSLAAVCTRVDLRLEELFRPQATECLTLPDISGREEITGGVPLVGTSASRGTIATPD